ncbi:MAG: ATP-binding protein [Chloroflexi bacterium]|nr:ATP-binding protein [Chloroflexota bacterium]
MANFFSSYFFSLQFRLVLGFTIVLALALAGVGVYVGYAVEQEVDRFEESQDEARTARVEQVISRFYDEQGDSDRLQAVLEQVGPLAGRRIIVRSPNGKLLGDSHSRFENRQNGQSRESGQVPLLVGGRQVGSFSVAPDTGPQGIPEPAAASLVSAVNRSLIWTGLAAAVLGTLLVYLLSRRLLAPVKDLGETAQHLGHGEFSRRAPDKGVTELRQLAWAFNSMASNLEDAEQQRRNLVADVAHELRTPVSNIQGYLEAIKDGLLQPDEGTINTIHGQVVHLGHLVEDLRLLAQAEAGALHLTMLPARMPDILRVCVGAVLPRADAKGVSVSRDADGSMPLIELDSTRISQVVTNLLENAIVHTPEGGSVAVTAWVSGGRTVQVAVTDSGPGIPPGDLDKVFDRFFRADPSRSRATGGAGLGLTIVKRLVEVHGGSVHVENVMPSGARFVFELPINPQRTSLGE